jgi:uncharacterized membrane protein
MALYFQNSYSIEVSIAFAWFDSGCGADNQNFRKQGWWNLHSDETFLAWSVDLRSVNRYAYFYAEAADGATWSGTGRACLFITQAAFDQCAFNNTNCDQQVDFEELDFNGNYDLTVQLGPDPGQVVLWPEGIIGRYLLVSSQTFHPVNDAILRYDGTTGAFIDTFAAGGGVNDPLGLAIGPDGNLYVASANTNNVLRYNGVTGAPIDAFCLRPWARWPDQRRLRSGPKPLRQQLQCRHHPTVQWDNRILHRHFCLSWGIRSPPRLGLRAG